MVWTVFCTSKFLKMSSNHADDVWGGVSVACVLQFQSPAGLCKHALQSLGLVILMKGVQGIKNSATCFRECMRKLCLGKIQIFDSSLLSGAITNKSGPCFCIFNIFQACHYFCQTSVTFPLMGSAVRLQGTRSWESHFLFVLRRTS